MEEKEEEEEEEGEVNGQGEGEEEEEVMWKEEDGEGKIILNGCILVLV